MLERYERTLRAALRSAGFPEPTEVHKPTEVTLCWGHDPGDPDISVNECGDVYVAAAHVPEATFNLEHGRADVQAWIALLWPLIARPIAEATQTPVAPEPAEVGRLPMDFAYFDGDNDDVWVVFTDRSRIWVGDAGAVAAGEALLGTGRGYAFGITPETTVSVFTVGGTQLVNPAVISATGIPDSRRGGWVPALEIAFTHGPAEAIELGQVPSFATQEDARAAAEGDIATTLAGHDDGGHFLRERETPRFRRRGRWFNT